MIYAFKKRQECEKCPELLFGKIVLYLKDGKVLLDACSADKCTFYETEEADLFLSDNGEEVTIRRFVKKREENNVHSDRAR